VGEGSKVERARMLLNERVEGGRGQDAMGPASRTPLPRKERRIAPLLHRKGAHVVDPLPLPPYIYKVM
ncbi:hypothetical protein HAX54_053505, partial [Datura stramonium]|nr:hypothetical protein [Datura stramonium]